MQGPLKPSFSPVPLADLIDQKQFRDLRRIMKDETDDHKRIVAVKAYLAPASAELERKGCVAEYLAYYVIYLHGQGMM